MHVIHVDGVGLQTAQARFYRVVQVIARRAPVVRAFAGPVEILRGEHELAPFTSHGVSDRFLRASSLVDISTVEEVDAQIARTRNDTVDFILRHPLVPKTVGTQPNHRYAHTGFSQLAILHRFFS